jgi:N-acetylmuramoyl-L-alanine amidase
VKRRILLFTLCALVSMLSGVKRPPGLDDVSDHRHWSYPDYTRVVVELSGPVKIKDAPRLLAPTNEKGARLYLDVEGVWVGTKYKEGIEVADGLLERFRIGQNTRTDIRVVLDLQTYARHRILTLTHPDRLVIDVYGERHGSASGDPGDAAGPTRLPPVLRPFQTVVLDPGHGGSDPGAIGHGRLYEKDVTLRLAKALRPKLEAKGFRVVMTREDDRALGLEERTAIAEAARGDLFVSLHANAARRASAHGIETYYPDANHERHTLRVAARENGVSHEELNALQRTLAKLRVSEVSPHSKQLAERVQHELVSGLPERYRPVTDLGVKKGPFFVLFLSNMASVLVESGFVSHPREAKRLRDGRYLDALAAGIATALADHRDAYAPVTAQKAP